MPDKPNILFIFPDQHRGDWIGNNESIPLRTPNLLALTQKGVTFTQAITPSPLCAPARACMALGAEYHNCGTPNNNYNMPLNKTTFYSLLRESGYHVTGCGKFDLHKKDLDWGLDGKRLLKEWGFSDGIDNEGKLDAVKSGSKHPRGPYMNYLEEAGVKEKHVEDFVKRKADPGWDAENLTPLSDEHYCDNWVGRNALKLLSEVPKNKPWFLQVNFTGPHEPYDITKSMSKLYEEAHFSLPDDEKQHTRSQLERKYRSYAAMIENIDRWVGKLISFLENRGELENTIVVYASDHGEMLGEKNRWGKNVPFQPSVHVPLIVAGPGYRQGAVYDLPVTIIDLAATFLDVAGVEIPEDMDCQSLMPLLTVDKEITRHYITSALSRDDTFGSWRMVFDGCYKYIEWNGEKYLFDVNADPQERINCIQTYPKIAEHMKSLLPASISIAAMGG